MDTDMNGLWLLVTVISGAVGGAMAIYGFRQPEPLALSFGIGISVIPMFISAGWLAAIASLAATMLFLALRRMR